MRGRKKLLLSAAVSLFLLAFTHALLREREPTYRGKTLAGWTRQYQGEPTPEHAQEASDAIHALCTNSLPALVKALEYDGTRRVNSLRQGPRWSAAFRYWLYRTFPDRKELRAEAAADAFWALKDEAVPAIPGLTKLAQTTNALVSYRALWTLSALGTNGLPPLLGFAADPTFPMRYKAMDVIGHMNHLGTNAHIAVPIFVNCTKEKDLRAVANAARALGCLAIEPETSVPALAAVLTNSDTEARIMAAMALSQFNARARSAAPALLKATEDKDDRAKLAATSALRIIAPEAFTNPPSQ